MNEHKDNLAAIITAEHGKVLRDAAGEVSHGIDIIEFACGHGCFDCRARDRWLITMRFETMHMSKNGQLACPEGQLMSAADQFYPLAF